MAHFTLPARKPRTTKAQMIVIKPVMRRMRFAGYVLAEIAHNVGVTTPTVFNHTKDIAHQYRHNRWQIQNRRTGMVACCKNKNRKKKGRLLIPFFFILSHYFIIMINE